MSRLALSTALLSVGLAPPSSAETWVVAKHGVRDFDELEAAVAWASEGDTIWVRGGEYDPVHVDGKGLHIVALDDGQAVVERMSVANLAVGQTLTLSGLNIDRVYPNSASELTMLDIRHCEGSVRVRDCVVSAAYSGAWVGLGVLDSTDVCIAGSSLIGNGGNAAVEITNSQVALFDSLVQGTNSGDGLEVWEGKLLLHGCAVLGGNGADTYDCDPGDGGDGLIGHGVAEIYTVDTAIARGEGGWGLGFVCGGLQGDPGQDLVLDAGVILEELAAAGRSWSSSNLVFDGDEIAFHYEGQPGDRLFVARAARGEFVWQLEHGGVRLISRPVSAAPRIGTATSGVLDVTLPIAKLQQPGSEGSFTLQAYVIDAQGRLFWLAAGALSVLDASRIAPYRVPVHVDGNAAVGGDGTSWGSAFNDLQEALDVTRESWESDLFLPREMWIAAGTYRAPAFVSWGDPGGFEVALSVEMYGGFTGSETQLDERDFVANPTVLTGDQLGDDLPEFLNRDDNAIRVMNLRSPQGGSVLLDGVTVRGGYGAIPTDGAGLRVFTSGGRTHVRNCTITDNRAGIGAGAYLSGGTQADPPEMIFESCDFIGNEAFGEGGGAIGTSNYSSTGVMRGTLKLLHCRFLSNRAVDSDGGALRFASFVSPSLSITGCEFTGNEARSAGAARIYVISDPLVAVVNCTIRDNHATDGPGGLEVSKNSQLQSPFHLRNSILWGNSRAGVIDEEAQISLEPGTVVAHYSCIEGWSGLLGGVGNHGQDPLLSTEGRLGPGSSAVDAGRNAVVPADDLDIDGDGDRAEALPLDLAGEARFIDDPTVADTGVGPPPVVDQGAYERQP